MNSDIAERIVERIDRAQAGPDGSFVVSGLRFSDLVALQKLLTAIKDGLDIEGRC